jgi:hypothetical protein
MERIHKQPGSKIIFKTNEFGEQEKIDAYYHGWSLRVRKTIKKAIRSTRSEKRLVYLKKMQKVCQDKSDDVILASLRHALNNPTPLNSSYANDCVLFRKQNIDNPAYKAIAALVEEKERIDASTNTNKEAVFVRDLN